MRKLICWACGKEIKQGKFLHCTACGVSFGENCWHTLNASLIEEGASRPRFGKEREHQIPLDEMSQWNSLGQMLGQSRFIKYLLDLMVFYNEKRPNTKAEVLFQCNNCMVDVNYRVADAELFHKLANALKNRENKIILNQEEIKYFQSVKIAEKLPQELQIQYVKLVKSEIPSQLQIINMAMGANWIITNTADVQGIEILNDAYI